MEEELRTEAVRQSPEGQYRIRKDIVRLMKQGKSNSEIAATLDVSERHVRATKRSYLQGGLAAIKPKKRGRKEGEQRTLTPEQEREIKEIITDKYPDQLKLEGCLWTRKNVRELVKMKYGLELPQSTMGCYLQRWGFSVQRPLKKAYKQDDARVQAWLEEEYPAIERQAKEEKAEIYWGDESCVHNTANYARGYAPIGQTPVLRVEAQKMKISFFSAITNQGKVFFKLFASMNADLLIEFLARLIEESDRKVFMIVDNLRVHHAKKVTEWVAEHKNEIALFFLPPYSPELNPDEYLNNDLKRDVGNRPMPRSQGDISDNTTGFLKALQANPDHVRTYFHAPHALYAA